MAPDGQGRTTDQPPAAQAALAAAEKPTKSRTEAAKEGDTSMINLTDDDLQFLKQLAHTLRSQDSAKPVIFQVYERGRRILIDPDYADGMCLVLGEDGEEFFEDTLEQAKEFLGEAELSPEQEDALSKVSTLDELKDFCDDADIDCHWTGYVEDADFHGAFLTQEACERHIAVNRHHYADPIVFTASIWRNPELERLLAILEKFAEEDAE